MNEKEIRDKLYDSTVLMKLITGEILVAIMVSRSELGLTILLPFELRDNELLDYCDIYATDSKFDFFATNILFIKRPNDMIKKQYFEYIIRDRAEELQTFIIEMSSMLQNMNSGVAAASQEIGSETIH